MQEQQRRWEEGVAAGLNSGEAAAYAEGRLELPTITSRTALISLANELAEEIEASEAVTDGAREVHELLRANRRDRKVLAACKRLGKAMNKVYGDSIRTGDGPGAYGGPAEEKIASPLEREALRMAGWKETRLQTLWSHPRHSGFHSVDEALDLVAREGAI